MNQKDIFDFMDERPVQRPRNTRAIIWNILTILVLLVTLCIGSYALMVFLNPNAGYNPFPPPTMPVLMQLDTPTPTPRNILPPTWTPTPTIPPTPTDTPLPSPTPFPTPTPGIPEENTEPSDLGSGPQFQVSEGNPQYIPNLYHPDAGCNWLGVAGQVFDMSGAPIKQMLIELGGIFNGQPISMITATGLATNYGEAGFEFVLSDKPVATNGTLWLQLIDQYNQPLSDKFYFVTYEDCDKNLVLVNFRQVRE